MTRINIINFLIAHRKYKSYLEIGKYNEQITFVHINCPHKRLVLSNSPTASVNNKMDFFNQNKEKFDLILIDDIHTEAQTSANIELALKCLQHGGIIILHDCLPPDEWHQRPLEEFREGENWNGSVWKAVLRFFNHSSHKCSVIQTDWGCGIIDTANGQSPLQLSLPEQLNYQLHFQYLNQYKKTVAEFLREYVKVYYHLACMGNWEEVFKEQMYSLQKNGFTHITLTILGSQENYEKAISIGNSAEIATNVGFYATEFTHFETPSMLAIQKYAQHHEGYVLYLHSKGVSSNGDESKSKWRRLMMKQLVDNWTHCMLQLLQFDVVGVNWRDMGNISHFCGNFWYASTKYIRQLPDFQYYFDHPKYQIWDSIHNKRLGCEFWIGAASKKPKVCSLAYRNVDFCNKNFWTNK